ncbi:MAG TPA: RtcB family protein [Kiritimatiellia bacterium]|jgi:tRNA-splicing ligase RtcB|nr:RtcB family protein [Lentisphaerota bacterium]HRV30873.1 RtcB family protein [Kiritimatiellia bacterium]
MRLIDDIPVWGDPVEENALRQIKRCARTASRVALMADHHKGYAVPIGGVVAYSDQISPSGVGFDIACGNKAVLTDAKAADVRRDISRIMDTIFENLTFGIGQKNRVTVDHELFDDDTWKLDAVRPLKTMAREQLGTIGGGNHYVDILVDEQERVWIGVHFGSRGLGHKTASWFLQKGGAKDGMDVDPLVIPAKSALGEDYLACMHLAGRYAYAGRDWVCAETARLMGARILDEVHNHHNFAWRETHQGEKLWVVRKGATPAFPGQKGFIGGSMGDICVIVEGVEHDLARYSLYSTVHGAGRVMGRMQAKGKYNRRTGKCLRPGLVTPAMMRKRVEAFGVELRGGGLDESPHCYKDLKTVLDAHAGTINILHTLRPIGVAMADTEDPYRD